MKPELSQRQIELWKEENSVDLFKKLSWNLQDCAKLFGQLHQVLADEAQGELINPASVIERHMQAEVALANLLNQLEPLRDVYFQPEVIREIQLKKLKSKG